MSLDRPIKERMKWENSIMWRERKKKEREWQIKFQIYNQIVSMRVSFFFLSGDLKRKCERDRRHFHCENEYFHYNRP